MLPDGEKRILHRVLGRLPIAQDVERDGECAQPEAVVEHRERFPITRGDRREQPFVGGGTRAHRFT